MATTQDDRLLKIEIPSLDENFLLINEIYLKEEISRLFTCTVQLLHEEENVVSEVTNVDIASILGQKATVTFTQPDGTSRQLSGIVNSFKTGDRDNQFSYYEARIVPEIWKLTQNIQCRIFQNKTVPEILEILFAGYEFVNELQRELKPRNYCVQYRESDFDFAARLMEEEGIYFYFEHKDSTHILIVADTAQSHRETPSKNLIPYIVEEEADGEFDSRITRLLIGFNLLTGTVRFRDHHLQYPTKTLEWEQPSRYPIADNETLELYDYPAGVARKYDGIDGKGSDNEGGISGIFDDRQKTVENTMRAIDLQYNVLDGSSDCSALTVGHKFTLDKHPKKELNRGYMILSVTHRAVQSPNYYEEMAEELPYKNEFQIIPHGDGALEYCPPRITPKPLMRGCQTAFIVGPKGEEIFTDKFGRVKGQFHWDREGKLDDNSSCWIPVAQSWAGNKWGSVFIPRIGMEVLVDFLEGDPDRPIINGCVYNPGAMPPYTLPDEKTKSTIKSDSSPDKEGFNEFRIEDLKGQEQIFIHGEKDIDVRNKDDRREWVGNEHHFIVKSDRRENIEGEEHRTVEGHQYQEIKNERHTTVGAADNVKVGGSYSLSVGGGTEFKSLSHSHEATTTMTLKSLTTVIEGSTGITLKCGGNFITLSPAGIMIQGTIVLINSGGAAIPGVGPQPVTPTKPSEAVEADDAVPGTIIELQKQSADRKEKTHKEGNEEKKSWIKIKMVDEEGNPVRGMAYKITTPEGRVASGSTDKDGKAEVKNIDPGNCEVTFPNLDKGAWEES